VISRAAAHPLWGPASIHGDARPTGMGIIAKETVVTVRAARASKDRLSSPGPAV
jgi:hypothetical protein